MTQEQASSQNQKQTRKTEQETAPQEQKSEETKDREQKLTDDVDEMLEEIDSVLEENAEEWVRGFVQKGGEASSLSKGLYDMLNSWTLGIALNVAKRYLRRLSADHTSLAAVAS